MDGKGIEAGGLAINWPDLINHKHGFTNPLPDRMEAGLSRSGVDTLHGNATLISPDQLTIGGNTIEAGHVLIATGSHPRPVDAPDAAHLIDSTGFPDLPSVPKRILSSVAGLCPLSSPISPHVPAARSSSSIGAPDR